MVYGQILSNIVLNIIELNDSSLVPVFTEGYDYCIEIDNVTDNNGNQIGINWYYDPPSGNFYVPAVLALIQSNTVIGVIQNYDIYITQNSSSYQYIIDITAMNPQPQVGWTYNGTSFIPSAAYYQSVIQNAMIFGNQLIIQAAGNNVALGITQAGQTLAVINYTALLVQCLSTGSLYEAISEINTMIADTSSTKTNLSPFITNDILYSYLNQIQSYLGIPVTPNPGP